MKKIPLLLLALMLIPAVAFCSTTKVLERDTALHPQGWIAGALTFKGGTSVTLNENNEVISGELRFNEHLLTVGHSSAWYPASVGEGARATAAFSSNMTDLPTSQRLAQIPAE